MTILLYITLFLTFFFGYCTVVAYYQSFKEEIGEL
jgi:hypothetical protein